MLLYCFRLIAILRRLGLIFAAWNPGRRRHSKKIASVASFFLSRIDSNIDQRIDDKLKKGVDDLNEAKLRSVKAK